MNKVVDDLGDAHDELVSLQAEASVNGLGGECLAHASRETMLSGVGFLLEDVSGIEGIMVYMWVWRFRGNESLGMASPEILPLKEP